MEKPYRYTVFCDKTNTVYRETNIEPRLHELQTYEPTDNPNVKRLETTRTVYIDTRYEAKMRLYNYITYVRKGLEIPSYNPFKNTEVGKSIPILNF